MVRLFVCVIVRCLSFYLSTFHTHMQSDTYTHIHTQTSDRKPIHTYTNRDTHVHLAKMTTYTTIVVNTWAKIALLVVDCRSNSMLLLLLFLSSHLKRNDSMEFARWHAPFTYKYILHSISFDFAFTNGLTISKIRFGQCKERGQIMWDFFFCYWCFS